jgi:calcium channel MID1
MQFPKLTPLQSRFAACLGTSILLLILYFTISPPQFAYASELESVHNQDHNHHRIDLDPSSDIDWGEDTEGEQYEAEFSAFQRSIIGRVVADVKPLANNIPDALNVAPGETIYYVFENSSVWGSHSAPRQGLPSPISGSNGTIDKRDFVEDDCEGMGRTGIDATVGTKAKRQAVNLETRAVYISVNTCLQPSTNTSMNGTSTSAMPQLTLYVSQLESNPKPGPEMSANDQQVITLVEGFANATIDASSNVYFSVSAPNLTSALTGQWNYVVSASIDASFQYYNNTTPFTFVVDTDSTSALLNTMNLTDPDAPSELRQQWMNISPPFNMFVFAQNTTLLNGIRNSYCGLTKLGQDEIKISSNMTNRGVGQNPKQQFYVEGLKPGQNYTSILAFNGVNGTADPKSEVVGGGGQVWQALSFATKSGMFEMHVFLFRSLMLVHRRQLQNHLRPPVLFQCSLRRSFKRDSGSSGVS